MSISLLFALGAFSTYVILTLIVLRISSKSPAAIVCILAMGIYMLALVAPLLPLMHIEFFAFSTAYWFLCAIFLLAFGAVYKSISLKILLNLLEREDRSESYDVILTRYILQNSFQNRLEIMRTSGFIIVNHGNFQLTEKGRSLASRVRLLREFFGLYN